MLVHYTRQKTVLIMHPVLLPPGFAGGFFSGLPAVFIDLSLVLTFNWWNMEYKSRIQVKKPLYRAEGFLWHPSLKDNPMQISKDTVGLHTVYRLRDETLDEVIGEAVVSELEAELRLHGIFVKPEHRGRGHAKSLMKSVLSLGEAKPITLCTGLGNIAFFKQFGFEVTEIGETLVHMQKTL